MEIKIEIKNRWTGAILFEYKKENNNLKDTLIEAIKRGAYLGDANLRGADLGGAYLGNANLCDADLGDAYLGNANLSDAYLCGADLGDADLRGANLRGAKEIPYIPLACPSDGPFIGWKKVHNHLIKLLIPDGAKRSSATSRKCRCDKALVMEITDLDGTNPIVEIENISREPHTLYRVDKMVYPDSFDEDRWNECSHGIHFYINKQDAIDY